MLDQFHAVVFSQFLTVLIILKADKRAHHNALERKRRDHIKDSFSHLRDSIPSLQGEKASLLLLSHDWWSRFKSSRHYYVLVFFVL